MNFLGVGVWCVGSCLRRNDGEGAREWRLRGGMVRYEHALVAARCFPPPT